MKWLKKLIKALIKALKKIWDKIRPFLGIILMVLLVLAPVLAPFVATLQLPAYLSWLSAGLTALGNAGWGMSALVGLGVGAVVAPEAVGDIVDNVGDVAGGVVDNVGEVIGGGANSLVGALFDGPVGFILLAAGAFWLLSSSGDDPKLVVVSQPIKNDVDSRPDTKRVRANVTKEKAKPAAPVGVAKPGASVGSVFDA